MKNPKCFIDTGAWIALINSRDQYHEQAVLYYRGIDPAMRRYTSSYVISETYTWLRYRTSYLQANTFLQIIRKSSLNGTLVIIHEDTHLLTQAEQYLSEFKDQKLSYVDACSLAMMKKEGIKQVFGFDHHFYLLDFEVVPG